MSRLLFDPDVHLGGFFPRLFRLAQCAHVGARSGTGRSCCSLLELMFTRSRHVSPLVRIFEGWWLCPFPSADGLSVGHSKLPYCQWCVFGL